MAGIYYRRARPRFPPAPRPKGVGGGGGWGATACGAVLLQERAVVRLPVLFDRLEQHQRVAATVPELVLGQVRRDGVDPGRELLGLVEAVEMTEHADEDLLHEVLRALPVSNGPIDEVEQPGLVAVYQGAEGLGVARQVLQHQPAVVKLVQRLALERARRRDCLALPREGCSHGPLHVQAGTVPL